MRSQFTVLSVFVVAILALLSVAVSDALVSPRRNFARDYRTQNHDRLAAGRTSPQANEPDIEAVWIGATQWATGVYWGGETFEGSIGKGSDFFGSSLAPTDYVPVKLEFSNSTTTLCQTFRRDQGYAAAGVGTFPGAAYDMTNPLSPRRLNICFVEDNFGGMPDHIWNPNSSGNPTLGKREYVAIMLSSYDGTGTSYAGFDFFDDAWNMDILYDWWPLLVPGFTLLQVLPAHIDIIPYGVTNVHAIPDDGEALLMWNYHTDPDSFVLYGSHLSPPAVTRLGKTSGAVRQFISGALTNGDSYYFRVETYEGGEKSGESRQFETVPGIYYSNMSRYGIWNGRSTYGGIWGYVDSASGDEYALICCRGEGVAVIDVNITPPVEVAFMPSLFPGTDAKEVQVYRHYAIVVKENEDIQIFDLANVSSPIQVSIIEPDGHGSHTCLVDGHYLYVQGNHGTGGLEIFDIADPANPVELGGFQPYYYHDIAFRNDTVYAFAIGGEGIDVIDVSNRNSPSLITTFNYPGSGSHNGIVTQDGRYLFVGDEVGVSGNHTRVFDISDVHNVSLVAHIIVDPDAIAHNCYLRGDLLFIGHYTEGCRVFEVSDPTEPVEVAFYDTWLPPTYGFDGMWTAYPMLPSGKIIASDMSTGLWVFTMADGDMDGIFDVTDNCLSDHNSEQADADGDGIGDACDPCSCPCANDPSCDGSTADILDVIWTISVFLRNVAESVDPGCPRSRTDFDNSGTTDILDVIRVVDVAFKNQPIDQYFSDPCG